MESIKLLLVGNPNAGKSTLYNVLTNSHEKVGNWHGVTVGAAEKKAVLAGVSYTVCDLPGIYSLASMSLEEKYTRDYLFSHPEDVVLFVSECATLERSVCLFSDLLKRGRKGVLLLTKKRAFERAGGRLDVKELARRLGVSVLVAEGKGRKKLKKELALALARPTDFHACHSSALLKGIYLPVKKELSRADSLFLNGFFCVPLFFVLLLFTFFVTFAPNLPGDFLKSETEAFFSEFLAGYAARVSSPVLRSFLVDGLFKSVGGVLCVLPQLAILFFVLILFEESGFLSRLAYLTDGFFSRLGLNGRAAFSLLMGYGCSAAAILTTRGLDEVKVQRRVIYSLAYVPCSAKLPVFLTLASSFFRNPFPAVIVLYCLGTAFAFVSALIMKGKGHPPFIMELAPLQIPRPIFVFKSLLFQLKQFIIKVATVVLAFFLFSWLLSSFSFSFTFCAVEESMLAVLCGWLRFLFAPIGMGDWRIAYAAISGLVAKENVAGILLLFFGGFPYGFESGLAFCIFLLCCSPCVSAVAATARELGIKRALAYAGVQTGSALLLSYALYFLLRGGLIVLLFFLPAVAILLLGKHGERIFRKRGDKPEKLHR